MVIHQHSKIELSLAFASRHLLSINSAKIGHEFRTLQVFLLFPNDHRWKSPKFSSLFSRCQSENKDA